MEDRVRHLKWRQLGGVEVEEYHTDSHFPSQSCVPLEASLSLQEPCL